MNISYTVSWRAEGELDSKHAFDREPCGHISVVDAHGIDGHDIKGNVSMTVAAFTVEQIMQQNNQDLTTALIILATRDIEEYLKDSHDIDTDVYI